MITKITERDSEFYNTYQSNQNKPQAAAPLNGYSSYLRAPGLATDAQPRDAGAAIGANRR